MERATDRVQSSSREIVAAVIVLVGLLAGTAGYYAAATSRPVERRLIDLERRALIGLTVIVVLLVAAGIAIAMKVL
ncbi:MAG: hypothetical protein JOZ24_03960 [Candidatus Eremiobacteraeota bacterium]|nr:hypothetical protein [Candidatus Eremiobacteraeota bacterium]